MSKLLDWVDKDDPHPNSRFSFRRTTRLAIAIFAANAILALPVGLIRLVAFDEQNEQQAEQKRKLEEAVDSIEANVRKDLEDGTLDKEYGEAARRLLGLPEE